MVGKQLIENVIKQIGTKVKTDYVHKEARKGLSTEDYTTLEKSKLAGLSNYDDTQIRAQLENKADKSEIPDVSNFITNTVNDLVNYYKKTETYTQNEIDQMVSRIPKFKIEVVQELPQTDISNTTIYLLVTGDESQNLYTEYIYVNNTWEKLGTQKLDISNLATKQELSDGLANKVDKVNGKGLSTNDFTNEYKEQIETNASDILDINEAQTNQDNRIAELEEENELLRQDIAGLPTNTATGESIDITDSAEMRFEKLDVGGNSKQNTTEGKNLLDIQYYEQGSIDASTGQDVQNMQNGRGSNYIAVLPNTTHTISANKNLQAIRLSEYTSEKEHIQRTQSLASNKLTLTTTANTYFVRWSFNYDVSTTVTEQLAKSLDLQLEQNQSESSYEPYTGRQASPSPEFEQPVHSVGDNVNLFDKDNVEGGYLDGSGNVVSNATYRVSDYIDVNIFKEITVSGNYGGSEYICFYDNDKNFISNTGMGTLKTRTISLPNNCYYVRVTVHKDVLNQYKLEKRYSSNTI